MLEIISTPQVKTLGPYSAAIQVSNLVFTAGQLGLDPFTDQLISSDVGPQTKQALKNLEYILLAANSSLDQVVKCTCFLIDMADYAKFNEVYTAVFGHHKPARSTVAVKELPRGASVEIECIAYVRS